jgi:hypothetical protein
MDKTLIFNNNLTQILSKYNSVLLIGPTPPPLGGVSVHIKRLNEICINTKIYDIKKSPLFLFREIRNIDAIHIHVFSLKLWPVLFLIKFFKNIDLIYTEHREIFFYELSYFKKFIYKIYIPKFNILFLVNKHIVNQYNIENINFPQISIIEPAFLPPNIKDEDDIINSYPDSLYTFIRQNPNFILANAFQIEFYNNTDMYGLDLLVNLIQKISTSKIDVSLVFAIANIDFNSKYVYDIKNKIKILGLQNKIFFLVDNKQIWPLFKQAKLFIRPTNTDGDAISLREALFFNCKSIASDICNRPSGTILFKNRDEDDLFNKVYFELSA